MIGYLDYSNKEADAFAVEVEAFLDEACFTAEKEAEPRTSRIEVIYGVIRDCREERRSDLEIARRVVLLYGPPPNDAAEPEAEPVAWMHPNGGVIQTRLTGLERDTYTIPLYTRPEPARKTLSDVEIADIYYSEMDIPEGHLFAFAEGFRQAEKHHGIGGGDE
jgi:hypothetical protein